MTAGASWLRGGKYVHAEPAEPGPAVAGTLAHDESEAAVPGIRREADAGQVPVR